MQEGREMCKRAGRCARGQENKGQAGDMSLPLGKVPMQKGGNNRGQGEIIGVGMSLFICHNSFIMCEFIN